MTGYDRLSHAYIAGEEDANNLAMAAVCGALPDAGGKPCGKCINCIKASGGNHPDIISIDRINDKRWIAVDQIRQVRFDAHTLPNEAKRKAYIIRNAHLMNTEAQNAFLRVLEEPPSFVVFILQTPNPAALLSTIRSRCVELGNGMPSPDTGRQRQPEDLSGIGDEIFTLAGEFISALGNNPGLARCMFKLEKLDKPSFESFIAASRALLSPAVRNNNLRDKALQAGDLLAKADEMLALEVSTGHISGMLCASLAEI